MSGSIEQSYDEFPRIETAFQDALDETLHPRDAGVLFEIVAGLGLPPEARVLDLGCGEGQRGAIELARRFRLPVLGIDPVVRNIEAARAALDQAAAGDPELHALVRFEPGSAESIPAPDASINLIWCREALYFFEIDKALADCRRVLRRRRHMVVYQMFNGDSLEPREAAWLWKSQGAVAANADHVRVEAAFARAGFEIATCIDLSSEPAERAQEERGEPGRRLLHAARLLRDPERYIARFGRPNYDIMLGDCFWHIYRMIGKLSARAYLLRAP
jgi:SAM-dependent methyltransferase